MKLEDVANKSSNSVRKRIRVGESWWLSSGIECWFTGLRIAMISPWKYRNVDERKKRKRRISLQS